MAYELDFSPTYALVFDSRAECLGPTAKALAIRCKGCGLVSHNPNDVRERYCGFCHVFHQDIPIGQRLSWVEERQKELKKKAGETLPG